MLGELEGDRAVEYKFISKGHGMREISVTEGEPGA